MHVRLSVHPSGPDGPFHPSRLPILLPPHGGLCDLELIVVFIFILFMIFLSTGQEMGWEERLQIDPFLCQMGRKAVSQLITAYNTELNLSSACVAGDTRWFASRLPESAESALQVD